MPYKISRLPHCVDCGKQVSSANVTRCRACSYIARKGKPGHRTFTPNDYRVEGDVAYLALTDKTGAIQAEAIIDADMLPVALRYRWARSKSTHTSYASCTREANGQSTIYLLHRVILGLEHGDPTIVDHRNRDGLDNRRENLRCGDTMVNAGNRPYRVASRLPGVTWCKSTQRWLAQARLNGRGYFLGRYDTEEEAAAAYRAFREEHGLPNLVDPRGQERHVDNGDHVVRPVPEPSSKIIGVGRCKQTGKWRVRFDTKEDGPVWLGRHDTEEEACRIAITWLTERGRPYLRTVARLRDCHDH